MYAKIENADSLVRDISTGAVINVNTIEFENLKRKRIAEKTKQEEIQRQQEEINCIKGELCEIKQMLMQLISSRS